MKKTLYFKLAFTLMLSGFATLASAKVVYLSSTGDDSKDGLTPETAVAHFSTAQAKAAAGDVIQVSGMINFATDTANTATPKVGVTLKKTLTIQGTSPTTDGFDGNNETRFIQANTSSYTLTLKNLKFYHGAYASSTLNHGGAFIISGSTVIGDNLIFDSNSTSGNTGNVGGAIMVNSTAGLNFKNCVFSNNTSAKAAAVYIVDATAAGVSMRFESCAFISNTAQATLGGSALWFKTTKENVTLTLVNCTVAKNNVATANISGGAVYLYSGLASSVVNIINCTITENTTAGSAGYGAGITAYNTGTGQFLGKLNIKNSIVENNTALKNSPNEYADLTWTSTAPTISNLEIHNSFIGRASTLIPVDCYSGTGFTNQYQYEDATINVSKLRAQFGTFNFAGNYYPLLATSPAIGYGSATYLNSLTPAVTTDQRGFTRQFTGGVCDAGAYEFNGITTTVNNIITPFSVYSTGKSIIISGSNIESKTAQVYTINGILKKSVSLTSNRVEMPIEQGFYLVKIDSQVLKVVTK